MTPLKSSPRRQWLTTLLSASLALGTGISAAQSAYPNKPIRLVVPFTPGGVTDTSGRLIAEQLSKRLGQQVVVDNKPGASGNIGTQMVAAAEPDGYTLLLGFDGTLVINPHVFPKVGFDTLKDFAPIGKIGDAVLILVSHPAVPAKSLKDVIALSKTQAGGLSYGTSGTGGTPHIAGELLKQRTGANLTHIPYKGGGQAMTDVLGGNIPLVYTAIAGAISHVKSGKLHAVAVSSAQRSSSLPDVPTFIENGVPDFEINSWVGLLAPAKTPKAVLDKLNTELNAVLADAAVRERLNGMGIAATPGTAEKFGQEIQRDLARYGAVVKSANIKAE
ncbi:LacI family transcriptional regulator [Limnohabitans sp. T6-5]|uniref:Bug family tripartite tricarboxylate transporter substrate binding protein n=1 Tax=Limnohabitans sp. T6-5 TaxID=1100724 RepID=UPI000D3B93AC|nr:tripartite tricarboxylate transporter substrate binding protein [Limnohabitans sp. T6-5]PUE05867.1 LacI family transcriptional regulator [Limnohabitans sp. T6-5]